MLNDYSQIKQAAQWYASELHLPIIPICSFDHSNMTQAHIDKCRSPGKMPILLDWSSKQTTTVAEVKQWCTRNDSLNLGLVLGQSKDWNLVGIDIDGEFGEKTLKQWSQQDLPETWEFATASGRRLLYSLPKDMQTKKMSSTSKEQTHQELALLVSGQQTVIPPSQHHTGFIYSWTEGHSPLDLEIANAPFWLLARVKLETEELNQSEPVEEQDWTEPILEGGRNVHLARLAGTLIAKKNVPKAQVLVFVKAWNRDHCHPPLPENEIDQMVEAIYLSEKSKKDKKKSTSMKPSQAALRFLDVQKEAGWLWRYTNARGLFYRTNLYQGPWRPMSEEITTKLIAESLVPINDEFDSTTRLKEVFKAMQRYLTVDEDLGAIDDVFNMGKYPDVRYVQLENGMFDWQTNTLLPWDPLTMSTLQIQATYDLSVDYSQELNLWNSTLEQWIPDHGTRMFIQEYVGYCLIPTCDFRTAVFLIGGGRNGKSLFLDTIACLFQNHLSVVPLERLSERFETAQLIDSLLNICADVDIGYLPATGTLKALIAGDDMRAEYKFGKTFRFKPVTRYIFSANNLPKTRDKSEGWMSRWRFVNFPNTFEVSPNFKTEFLVAMTSTSGKLALLHWAIEGLQRLFKTKYFTQSASMDMAAKEYQQENDNVVAFLDQAIQKVGHIGKDTQLVASIFYSVYRQWTLIVGAHPVSQVDFNKKIKHLGYEKGTRLVKGRTVSVILGVQLQPNFSDLDLVVEYNMQLSMMTNG